jgi:uncharacterized cupredoxin-like copper-binding protein
LLLATVALVACGGSGGRSEGAASAASVTIRGTDTMRFEPASVTVRANTPTTLTLDDRGAALVHDWTVDDLGGRRVEVVVQPNRQGSVQFTAPPGTYSFYCAQPGHRELGMVGTLTAS